jgi:DNA polymerase-3 subunit alpha
MFGEGETDAVFQFSSDGMKGLLQNMKANCIDDLIAAVALYRPGCLANNWHNMYCNRKHGHEDVEYLHEDLEKELAATYGIPVYQEQFIKIFHLIGDISLSDSDTIRSALGKKKKEKLEKFKDEFIKNATVKMGTEKDAIAVWNSVEKAAGYNFNKSHAAVYAIAAYISQYFKVNHTEAFWSAVLSWDAKKNKMDDLAKNRRAAVEMGVSIKLPDVSLSGANFSCETDDTIRWSLCGVKGIGPKTAAEITSKQPFDTFDDFYKRVHKSKVKFDSMISMAYAGAFDCFGDRREILTDLHERKDRECPKLLDSHMIFKFHEAVGFFEEKLKRVYEDFDEEALFSETDVRETAPGDEVYCGGMLSQVRSFRDKRANKMGKAYLIDQDESIELTIFSDVWSACKTSIRDGNVVVIYGAKSNYDGRENQVEVRSVDIISK